MTKHLRYLRYVVIHKYFVFVAGHKVGVSFWQLLVHDFSKFGRAEWKPYVEWFYGPKAGAPKNERLDDFNAFMDAFRHHWQHNPHHWEYWLPRVGVFNNVRIPLEDSPRKMPDKFVKEMVADWMAAGRAINGTWDGLPVWYAKTKDKQQLHPATRRRVEEILKEQGYNV